MIDWLRLDSGVNSTFNGEFEICTSRWSISYMDFLRASSSGAGSTFLGIILPGSKNWRNRSLDDSLSGAFGGGAAQVLMPS